MLDLLTRCTAESESSLNGAICASYITTGFHNTYPCENLIDPNGLNKVTHTGTSYINADFTYKLVGVKGIQSIFIGNSEFDVNMISRIKNSRITIGNNADPSLNAIC